MEFKLYHDLEKKKKEMIESSKPGRHWKNFQFDLLETISGSSSSDFHTNAERLTSKIAI